jgi:cytochrome c553
MLKINKYINVSPDSPGMPAQAPGRTGNYIGKQIINAYMERHPETTMQDLLRLQDAQKIMDLSRYKPRQRK